MSQLPIPILILGSIAGLCTLVAATMLPIVMMAKNPFEGVADVAGGIAIACLLVALGCVIACIPFTPIL